MTDTPDVSRRRFIKGIGVAGGLVFAGGTILAACGGDDSEPADGGDGGSTTTGGDTGTTSGTTGGDVVTSGLIGVTLNGLNDYTRGVATGVYAALEGTDFEVEVVQGDYDPAKELANIENFINKGAVGIVIQPNTIDSAGAGAAKAKEKDIPVGNCIWPGPSDNDQYFDGVAVIDSVEGGRLIGNYLKEQLPDGGKIVVVQGVIGQGFSERIDEGLDEVLEGSNIEVVVREQGFFDRAKAVAVVETAYQANPDIVAIVDYAAAMSNGICQWMKDNDIELLHVTSDADEEMITWYGTPYLAASRYYSSAETGKIAADAVLAVLGGGKATFETDVFQTIATADNIDQVVADHPFMFMDYKDKVQDI